MIGMECRKRLFVHSCSFMIAMLVSIGPRAVAQTTTPPDRTTLPVSPAPFSGTITSDYRSSTAHPAAPLRAPEGAPNVLLILLDDAGYAQTATFGGLIPTPTLDALASRGLRYTRFHVTALCSPTRAALITGRNHHSVGFGVVSEQATGYPHGRTGYVIDHIQPLACGGADTPSNMQWQTKAAAAAKDKTERAGCR